MTLQTEEQYRMCRERLYDSSRTEAYLNIVSLLLGAARWTGSERRAWRLHTEAMDASSTSYDLSEEAYT